MRRALLILAAGLLPATACSRQDAPPHVVNPPVETGRIQGFVRLRGATPVLRTEPNSKSPEICGSQVPATRIQLGPNNGVRHAFVYLDGIASSGALRPAASLTIEQKDCTYAPRSMAITRGVPIDIVNGDPVLHNVHASALSPDGLQTIFNIAQPVRGQRTRIESELKPGIITLTCEAGHPWMSAHMLVTDHDFVAVADEQGSFAIEGVPAGTYPIKMWHEGVTLARIVPSLQQFEYEAPYEITKDVVVTAGKTVEVNFDLELRPAKPGVAGSSVRVAHSQSLVR